MISKIYSELVAEFQKEGVIIREVSSVELKRNSPNTEFGFISYNCNGDMVHQVCILIDCSIEKELKLNILLHELGHFNFWRSLGCDQLKSLKENEENWLILDEYKAFKFQLNRVYEIALTYDYSILKNTMITLIDRHKNDPDLRYREAINSIFQEEIWQQALDLTMLNHIYSED